MEEAARQALMVVVALACIGACLAPIVLVMTREVSAEDLRRGRDDWP